MERLEEDGRSGPWDPFYRYEPDDWLGEAEHRFVAGSTTPHRSFLDLWWRLVQCRISEEWLSDLWGGDHARRVGERVGRAMAEDVVWGGLDPQDAEELLSAGLRPGTEEWRVALEAARDVYQQVIRRAGM